MKSVNCRGTSSRYKTRRCIAVFEGMFVEGRVCKAVAPSSCDIAKKGSWSLPLERSLERCSMLLLLKNQAFIKAAK